MDSCYPKPTAKIGRNRKKQEEIGSLGPFWPKVEKRDKNAQNCPKHTQMGQKWKKQEKTGKKGKLSPIMDRTS